MISDFFLALLLALIQGLTEFLPVSSSAHLLFPSLLFVTKDFGIVFDLRCDTAADQRIVIGCFNAKFGQGVIADAGFGRIVNVIRHKDSPF